MNAKEGLEKSIRYEANFRLICNCLQENILILRNSGPVSRGPRDVVIYDNQLRLKDKTQFLLKAIGLRTGTLLVHQLHSFLATRGGSPGSC